MKYSIHFFIENMYSNMTQGRQNGTIDSRGRFSVYSGLIVRDQVAEFCHFRHEGVQMGLLLDGSDRPPAAPIDALVVLHMEWDWSKKTGNQSQLFRPGGKYVIMFNVTLTTSCHDIHIIPYFIIKEERPRCPSTKWNVPFLIVLSSTHYVQPPLTFHLFIMVISTVHNLITIHCYVTQMTPSKTFTLCCITLSMLS